MATFPTITFFFPYHEISGVPILFSRMAIHLAEKLHLQTQVIDYPDGYMFNALENHPSVRRIPFHSRQRLDVSPDTVLVMQTILPHAIRPELHIHPDTRILFWTLHPFNLVQTLPNPWLRNLQYKFEAVHDLVSSTFQSSLQRKLRRFVTHLVENKSIIFMDEQNYWTTCRRLHMSIDDPIYVPVPSEDSIGNLKENDHIDGQKEINVAWVGRLADFKIHILIYTMRKLSEYAMAKKCHIHMTIIGEGPLASKLDSNHIRNAYFKFQKVGVIKGAQLDHYLAENVDVLMAMGTSALDGARLGIPTILLDLSYTPVPDGYKFRWLYEAKGYSLADVLTPEHFEYGNDSMGSAMDLVRRDYKGVSALTYQYYLEHHSISFVANLFLDALSHARFRYGEIESNLLRKGVLRTLYEYVRDIRYAS